MKTKTRLFRFSSRYPNGILIYPFIIRVTYAYFHGVWMGIQWEETSDRI